VTGVAAACAALAVAASGVLPASAAVGLSVTAARAAKTDTFATSVSAGNLSNCAAMGDGTLACWGTGVPGVLSPPAGSFSAVSAGPTNACALAADGSLQCWGDDTYGTVSQAPAGVFSQVSMGYLIACALTPGDALQCWGKSQRGDLATPAGTYTAVAAGVEFGCALATDGTVRCWGDNTYGQVSDAPAGDFTHIATGLYSACAIATDGTLHCWGTNTAGRLENVPAGTFTQVSVGADHACAIATDGTVHCWGDNSEGQLNGVPAGTFTDVSAGSLHSCAVATAGVVRCWGDPAGGALGTPPVSPAPAPPLGTTGQPYSFAFARQAGNPPALFSVSSGSLPAGLSLSPDGILSGTPASAGKATFTVTAASLLGSASSTFTVTTGPDVTPPGVTISMITQPGGWGWYTHTPVTGTVTADETDTGQSPVKALSCGKVPLTGVTGIGTTSASGTFSVTAQGSTTVSCTATDAAGNTSAPVIEDLSIDTGKPTVTCTRPAPTFLLGSQGNRVHGHVTDQVSGPRSSEVAAEAAAASLGQHTVQVIGSDRAGNEASVTCPYSVASAFLGFRAPHPGASPGRVKHVSVSFRLGSYPGTALTKSQAQSLATRVTLSSHASGGSPVASAACRYAASAKVFRCTLAVPGKVRTGRSRLYYLTAQQRVNGSYQRIRLAKKSATADPEKIHLG